MGFRLLLVGVLLLVAATATTAGDAGAAVSEDDWSICKLKCEHHQDLVNKTRCVTYCVRYRRCVDWCARGGTSSSKCFDICRSWYAPPSPPPPPPPVVELAAVSASKSGEDIFHGGRRRLCELKCQHHHNTVNKKRCVDLCVVRYRLALGGSIKEDDEATAAAVTAGEDIIKDNDGATATAAAAGGAIRQVV